MSKKQVYDKKLYGWVKTILWNVLSLAPIVLSLTLLLKCFYFIFW